MKFPPVEFAEDDGLLALGGDHSIERLLLAYRSGIFPWYSEGQMILWWSPDPRFVLFPKKVKISKSLKQLFNRGTFEVTYDQDFQAVISSCKRAPRKGQDDTWITEEMLKAYIELHVAGYAHSVEVWYEKELVGGLYGVSIGNCFFGESMFSKMDNASKVGFITLVRKLESLGFGLIDCQVHTDHLKRLGAGEIPRSEFINILKKGLENETISGNWGSNPGFMPTAS